MFLRNLYEKDVTGSKKVMYAGLGMTFLEISMGSSLQYHPKRVDILIYIQLYTIGICVYEVELNMLYLI